MTGPTSAATDASGAGSMAWVARWWPALFGLGLGTLGLMELQPWARGDPPTWLPIGLALAYLMFGLVRGQLNRPSVLRLELAGLGLFSGTVVLALAVPTSIGQYVAGAAWLAHAGWDVVHHSDLSRHDAVGVVPRGYAEFCIVIDLLVGASLIAAPAL